MERNNTNARYNKPMTSIDAKGIEFIGSRLAASPNSKFVVLMARVNSSRKAYIGTTKNGAPMVSLPLVGDYADKSAQYAGLSDKEDGAGLFFDAVLTGRLAERYQKLLSSGSIRAGCELMLAGTTAIRTSEKEGREFKNAVVYASVCEVSFFGKKENAVLGVSGNATPAAAPAAKAAPVEAVSAEDFEAVDDDGDLPF